ncbi:MAG: hypothetical protein QM741_16725 [Rudaea sp.]|uniref:hypothetical protein n=1 Tax=Rudaea sp. TaxID=2136325 RepID=UPI0039E727A7
MKKKHPLRHFHLFAWTLAALLAFPGHGARAAAPLGTGTYTGIYSGNDYGTVTIVVDAQGNVTCDFFSSPGFVHYQGTGTVDTTSWFLVNCATPDSDSYRMSMTSSPDSAAANAVTGFWGGGTSSAQISGSYTAYYVSTKSDPAGSITSATFAGLWYDPAYTGTGFNILPSSAVGLIVTYYGVDTSGAPLWLISDYGPTTITIGTSVTLNMSHSNSGTFLAPVRVPVSWGQITLTFTSCTTATATLDGTDGKVSENLTLLTGVIGMLDCR